MTQPVYVWADPHSAENTWWVDAWNGVYLGKKEALEEGSAGVGRPWVLFPGEGVVPVDELVPVYFAFDKNHEGRFYVSPRLADHLVLEKHFCYLGASGVVYPLEGKGEATYDYLCNGFMPQEKLKPLHEIVKELEK